jgi:hypothetical protein
MDDYPQIVAILKYVGVIFAMIIVAHHTVPPIIRWCRAHNPVPPTIYWLKKLGSWLVRLSKHRYKWWFIGLALLSVMLFYIWKGVLWVLELINTFSWEKQFDDLLMQVGNNPFQTLLWVLVPMMTARAAYYWHRGRIGECIPQEVKKHWVHAVATVAIIMIVYALAYMGWKDFMVAWNMQEYSGWYKILLVASFLLLPYPFKWAKSLGVLGCLLGTFLIGQQMYRAFERYGDIQDIYEGRNPAYYASPMVSRQSLESTDRLYLSVNAGEEPSIRDFWLKKHGSAKLAEVMVRIAYKESGYNHFEKDGKTPYKGRLNPDVIGIYQIDQKVHRADILRLGPKFDPKTKEGNLNMAAFLLARDGFRPWRSSFSQEMVDRIKGAVPDTEKMVIVAPVNDWTPVIDFGTLCPNCKNIQVSFEGSLYVRINGASESEKIKYSKDVPLTVANVRTRQYQSAEAQPITLTFTFFK